MALSLRQIRLRGAWLFVLPFFWFARPTPGLLLAGGLLAALGLSIRSWAAGVIRKDAVLTTAGPYAHTRNPLYLGSFFLGLGVMVAGGQWVFVVIFWLFFLWIYSRTMRFEATLLHDKFGKAYADWAAHVPLFVPRLTPYRGSDQADPEAPSRFSGSRWRGNREYEAVLGAVVAMLVLAGKWWWG